MNVKVLTPIIDRNGKRTSVWRKPSTDTKTRPIGIPGQRSHLTSSFDILGALPLPRNPYIRVMEMPDGSKSLYVEADKLLGAIAHDSSNELSYRLPVSQLFDAHNVSPHHRHEYEKMVERGDLIEQHYAFRDAMGSKSLAEIVKPLLDDDASSAELRKRFFDHRGFGEEILYNEDGEVEGYLYHFRDKEDITLEEIRPDLVVDNIEDDMGGFKEWARTEKYLREFHNYDDGTDSAIRDEYMDEVLDHIERYGHPKAGSNRIVFFTEDKVIKFPLGGAGIIANANEYTHGNIGEMEEWEGVPIADNEMYYTEKGMPYLVMERVNTADAQDGRSLPAWSDLIDEYQVGINSKGQFVAYDL